MNISKIFDEISETIFPSNIYCISCGSLIDRTRPYGLCDECVRKMHWITGKTCAKCGKALPETYHGVETPEGGNLCYDCSQREHYFTRGFSCITYGLHEREIMMDIKYHNKGYMARKMGDVLFDKMEELISQSAGAGINPFDLVIPVPVSRKRLIRRGYNQSEVMARQFLKRWRDLNRQMSRQRNRAAVTAGVPILATDILQRSKETTMLRSLNPSERRMVLRDAFTVREAVVNRIKNKSILLIDDIYTTGATADACSKTLLEGGAQAVYLLTMCSGGNNPPQGTSCI